MFFSSQHELFSRPGCTCAHSRTRPCAWCWPRCTGSVSAIFCESCLDAFLLRLCGGGSCMRHPCCVCSCPRFGGTNVGDSAGAVGDAAAAMPDLESLVCVSRMIFLCKHQMFSLILLKMHKIHKTALRRHSRHVSWMSICHLCASS